MTEESFKMSLNELVGYRLIWSYFFLFSFQRHVTTRIKGANRVLLIHT